MSKEPKILTLTELAAYIPMKKRTLYNWIKKGLFPVDQIPGTKPRRWNSDHVDAWKAGRHDKN